MIFINLKGNPPPEDLIKEGEELTKQLFAIAPEERKDFIEINACYWSRVKITEILETQKQYFKHNDPSYRRVLKQRIDDLRKLTQRDAELSAVAKTYILNYPEQFIRRIVSA